MGQLERFGASTPAQRKELVAELTALLQSMI